MSKKLQVKVNGKPFEVEVSDFSGGSADVTVNGTQYAIEIEEAGGAVAASCCQSCCACHRTESCCTCSPGCRRLPSHLPELLMSSAPQCQV